MMTMPIGKETVVSEAPIIPKKEKKYMKLKNIRVYDIEECFKASKYPMATEITDRIKSLAQSSKGEGHDQFLTGIRVAFDLTFTVKAWTEAERYRFLEFVSSQSTMHRIAKFDLSKQYNKYVDPRMIEIMEELKGRYNETNDPEDYLRLLYSNPCGFELTARLKTNYRCLKTIYSQRKNHRLPEWREFCAEIEKLPYAMEIIIGAEKNKKGGV